MAVNIFQDLDYLASTLGLPRWSRAVNCCAKEGENLEKLQQLCPLGLLPSGPPSSSKEWNHRSRCRIFGIHGLSAMNVSCDWTHAKYLGSDLCAFGAVLYLWTFHVGPGNEQDNLRTFDAFLKNFCRTQRPQAGIAQCCLQECFLNKKGVKLKGKAAQVKALGLPLLLFWEKN